ncbi:flavin reductase family protein [Paracoccus sp. CPCC 101403]|uniref:Flavin reductase family protein n=1 Tax=Paracoccus broussonetiae TaxID=3075834 RepID=A0ABU3EJ14_9RHOB|nr:flavin reductase family protein [Paracoccus sp. CPCC 101403]MDT1064247.1 flavin reductase family protein [Paracoccus sp. CPCC 101403]
MAQVTDPAQFRQTMSCFATGVAILTTAHDGRRFGMTINSLTSVSLDPAQILVCINHGSPTGEAIKNSGNFAVSLLAHDQTAAARSFVGRDAARFNATSCTDDASGVPLVDGALATVICRLGNVVSSGDHEILIGEVTTCLRGDGDPLVFFAGQFGGFRAGAPHGDMQRGVA